MKKHSLFILLAFFCFFNVIAQQYAPFPIADAEWTTYYVGTCINGGIPDTIITKYTLNGDTTLHNATYHKLTSTVIYPPSNVITYVGAIREDKKKIYFLSPTVFPSDDTLLYDFNANIGDSVSVYIGYRKVAVQSIDSILIGDEYNRRLFLGSSFYNNGEIEYWIEGVGSTVGLITNTFPIPTCGTHYYELLCFKQGGVIKYLNPDFESCDATNRITAIADHEINTGIKVYPNPAIAKQIYIDNIKAYNGLTGRITDYTGKVILVQPLNDLHNTIVLPNTSGLYLLMIWNKEGQLIKSQKIVN